jgi:hypothetical protein
LIGRRLRAGMSLVPYVFIVYGAAALVLVDHVCGPDTLGIPATGICLFLAGASPNSWDILP